MERGDGNPTLDTLYALADALGVPLAALLERAPASVVVRAGEGAHVEGAALDAHLIDRFERPGVFGELYAIRFHVGEVRSAPPHPFGVEERLHVHGGRVRVGPADAVVELRPGRLRVLLRLGAARLRSARRGLGHPADPDREVVAMKRAARMEGVAGFGIDQVADAVIGQTCSGSRTSTPICRCRPRRWR